MADKKRKSIYDYKLKDVNKDDKTNFGDTWLGDALGFDGKVGTQGPGLKDSMKGARRNMGLSKSKRPKARSESTTSTAPTKSKRPKSRDSEPLQRGPSKRRGPRNKPELSSRLDPKGQTTKSPDKKTTTAKERVSKASEPKLMGYTWNQYKEGNNLGRLRAGLPMGLSKTQFEERANSGAKEKVKKASTSGSASRKRLRSARGAGMAKGGMVCDTSKKDHRKSGMFTKTGSPRGLK